MLTVVTTSTDDRLTSLDTLKTLLGLTTTGADDRLTHALAVATDAIATYLGYYPLHQTYRESLPGYGDNALLLSAQPVTSVTGLYYVSTGTVVHPDEYSVADNGILTRNLGFPWSAGIEWDLDSHIAPGSERNTFLVDYAAGWYYTTGAGRTLPYDIEQAALEVAKGLYYSARDSNVVAKTVGALSVTYADRFVTNRGGRQSGVPPAALTLLGPYQRLM